MSALFQFFYYLLCSPVKRRRFKLILTINFITLIILHTFSLYLLCFIFIFYCTVMFAIDFPYFLNGVSPAAYLIQDF